MLRKRKPRGPKNYDAHEDSVANEDAMEPQGAHEVPELSRKVDIRLPGKGDSSVADESGRR